VHSDCWMSDIWTASSRGYALFVVGLPLMVRGDNDAAYATFSRVAEVANRFGDQDLLNMARCSMGEVRLQMGRTVGPASPRRGHGGGHDR
jgi:hypothetical protein